jgi:chromosome segregation ATPase
MEPVKFQRSAPSVRLLNEIDILLTQVRLAELYLKQAQAAAADQVARIQERYESELENLRALIRQKERSFDESSARIAATETLNLQIQDLQAHLEEHRRLLEQRDGDFQRVTAELVTSRSQTTQLQSANTDAVTAVRDAERIRQALQTELGKLRDEIGQKTRELRQHQSAAQESEQCLQEQLGRLKDELAQAQDLVSAKGNDLQQTRAGFEARLAELQTALGQNDQALQERHAAIAELQRSFEIHIHDLRGQLDQKQALLESREGELQQLRPQLADLQARIDHLEFANQEAVVAASHFDFARRRYEAELEELRNEINHKDQSLAERQAAGRALEESHRDEIAELQNKLAQNQSVLDKSGADLHETLTQLASLQQRIPELQAEARAEVEARLAELETALAEKDRALQERDATVTAIERDLQAKIHDFGGQLAQKQDLLAGRDSELAALRTELSEKDRSLAERQVKLEAQEADHQAETEVLKKQLAHSRGLQESKERELEQVLSEQSALRERITQLEAAGRDAEASANRQTEALRLSLETELNELRATAAATERSFVEREAEHHSALQRHAGEIAELRSQLADRESSLEQRTGEVQEARTETAALREQVARLDVLQKQTERLLAVQAEQIRQRVRAEFGDLDARLASKDRELQAVRESAAELQASLNATIDGLRLELAEKLQVGEDRNKEIGDLREKTRGLLEQIAQLESSNQHLQAGAADSVERYREAHQVELAALREQLRLRDEALADQQAKSDGLEERMIAQVQDFQNRLADQQLFLESREDALARAKEEFSNRLQQKDDTLQTLQVHATELQDRLTSKTSELQTQLLEKQRHLENISGEIANLKASVSGLSEQATQLASAARDAESRGAAEVERVRLEHQAELLSLREELRGKQHALAEQEARATGLERRLGTHISGLETQLAAKQRLLEEREEALNTANSAAVALQERYTGLEASSRDEQISAAKEIEQVRRAFDAELAGLRNELQQKDWDLAQRQASIDNLAQGHESQIQTLEGKLTELRHVAENRAAEIDQAISVSQRLLSRIGQLESAAADAEATAMSRDEQITRRDEAQIATLQLEIERKTVALEEQGAARNDLERTYHAELSRLRAESQEKHMLLENRNEEFVGVKNAMESLRERWTQGEATAAHAEQAAAEDRERLRAEYEAQLAALREELSARERSDKDQGAVETAQTKPGQTFHSRSDRRWRSSGGWKRRWKT